MNHARTLLLLLSVVCTWACTVPTLEELEEERASGCDAEHACHPDWVCFEGKCLPREGPGCTPGDTLSCGNEAKGECRPGMRLCGQERSFGACIGEVTPIAEVCNGKDDDCDGSPDEALTQACAKQEGVCKGARETCTNGTYAGCTDALYAQYSQVYQPFETTCDFQDNDCDGREDRWEPTLLISQTSGTPLGAVAVNRISAGELPTVLALIPSNGNLEARAISPRGIQVGSVIPPAPNFAPTSPVLVANEDKVTAAWVEVTLPGPNLPETRLLMAVMDGGGTVLSGPIQVQAGLPQDRISDIQLAVNPTRVLVVVTFSTNREVYAFTIGRNLDFRTRSQPILLGQLVTSNWVHAAAMGDSQNSFLVTFEHKDVRQLGVITETGQLLSPVTALRYPGSFTNRPFIIPAPSADKKHLILYVENSATSPGAQLLSIPCTTGANGFCEQPTSISSFTHGLEDMKLLTYPGFRVPNFVLLKWRDKATDAILQGYAPFNGSSIGQLTPVPIQGPSISSDTLVLSPEGTLFQVYLESPPAQLQSAVPGPPDAKVRPFCWRQ